MTTPFVRQLKLWLWKEVHITYMVGKRSSETLKCNTYVDEIKTFDEDIFAQKHIWKWCKLIFQLRELSQKNDTVFVFDKHWIVNLTLWLWGFKRRIGFNRLGKQRFFLTDRIYWDATKREVEYYLDLLSCIHIQPNYDDQEYDPQVSSCHHILDDTSKKKIDALIHTLRSSWKKIIWISTGWWNALSPKWDCRWWTLNKRKELSQQLLMQWNIVVLLWSKSDRNLDIDHENLIHLLWKYSIVETIYIVNALDFVICQESWFAHFVWCTRTPMLALAGPTNPYRFYPHTTQKESHPIWWLWKCKKECYDVYGWYSACKGDEIDKITVADVLENMSRETTS